jgi:translation initiation factor 2 gamma subunit (eIF-2gamma)
MLTILKAAGVLPAAFLFLATEEHRPQKEDKEFG